MGFKEKWRFYQNYIIIGILSLISVFFLPMLGTEIGLGFNVPNTWAGWVVWILTKLCVVAINIMLLDQFIKQAKVNIRDNEQFKEADAYYTTKNEEDEYLPTPKEFISKLYKTKGVTTTITSALSVFGLTSAILTFDWVSMLTYLFTVVFGVIFGWMTMNNVEEYWTDTYYRRYLRDKVKEDMELAKKEHIHERNDTTNDNSRDNILDSNLGTSSISYSYGESMVVDNNFSEYRFLGRSTDSSDSITDGTNTTCQENI